MRVHAAVVVEVLLHAARLATDGNRNRAAFLGHVSLQQLPVFFKLRVEENVQDGVQAGGQWEEYEGDGLHYLGADGDGGDQRREREKRDRAEEDAVGEDEPGNVLNHARVGVLGKVLLLQVAVEFSVDDGH